MAQSHRGPDPVMSSSRPSIDLRTGEVVILEDIEPFFGGEVDQWLQDTSFSVLQRSHLQSGAFRQEVPDVGETDFGGRRGCQCRLQCGVCWSLGDHLI